MRKGDREKREGERAEIFRGFLYILFYKFEREK